MPANATHNPAASRLWLVPVLLVAIVSLFYRFHDLDHVPGINGDESWYGVQIERRLAGEPYTLQAPTGVLVDPFQPPTEELLLRLFGPSFLVLRLPVALWQCAGLLAVLLLHRWVYGDWLEAALTAAFLAALPMHLGYSRLSWSPSYLLSTSALVLYPALRIAEHGLKRSSGLLLLVGAVLSVWSHLTAILYIALVAAAAALAGRRKIATVFRGHRTLALISSLTALVLSVGGFALLCRVGGKDPARFLASAVDSLVTLFRHPDRALYCITMLGDLVSGTRAFHYFAGLPEASGVLVSRTALALVILAATLLARSPRTADRAQAMLWCLVPWALLVTGSLYRMDVYGNERYVIWTVTASAPLLVRGLRQFHARLLPRSPGAVPLIVLAASAVLLLRTRTDYFGLISTGQHRANTHRAWWTADQEPKAQAARLIASEATALRPAKTIDVYAEDWWLQYPVQYLLGTRFVVHGETIVPPTQSNAPWFAVTFTGSAYHNDLLDRLKSAHQSCTITSFPTDKDTIVSVIRPVGLVFHVSSLPPPSTNPAGRQVDNMENEPHGDH